MVLSAYLLAVVMTTAELKQDKGAPKSCFEIEKLVSDLNKDGFKVIRVDRDIAIVYLAALIKRGVPQPPEDLDTIQGLLFITLPQVPDRVMVGIINVDGDICNSALIPTSVHESIIRGA